MSMSGGKTDGYAGIPLRSPALRSMGHDLGHSTENVKYPARRSAEWPNGRSLLFNHNHRRHG